MGTMKISQNCLDLIKKWEGFRREAYLDPVGIPTIGYGTIRYPDGRPVRLGDVVTEQQAEGFLLDECEDFAEQIAKMVEVPLTQNQFDALVSFTYNVGPGAFKNSTLRRVLNTSDVAKAAAEFARWNKGTIDGVKQVLPGLVSRRADETALFKKKTRPGKPIAPPESKQDAVDRLRAFRDGDDNLIVAYAGNRVVEVHRLATSLKEDFIDLLALYPRASTLEVAGPGDALPGAPAIVFAGRAQTPPRVETPPVLHRPLLVRGMSDEDEPGNDIKELQARLKDLGYYEEKIDGVFGRRTDAAAKDFQAIAFGPWEADGKVGPRTWAKLWGEREIAPSGKAPVDAGSYLQLTRTNTRDRYGLFVLLLEYVRDGTVADRIEVCSGQPRHQEFRTGRQSRAKSKEPLPEGRWVLGEKVLWASGEDVYHRAVFADGEGPVKIRLEYEAPHRTARTAILIHLDWNRGRGAPGTLGCIGVYDVADFRRLVGWVRDTNPRKLYVDWGLGTCPVPG